MGIISSIIQAEAQKQINENNIAFQKETNAQNRAWQLADREHDEKYEHDIWNRNNAYNEAQLQKELAYNSPEQQMARLKAAGLNPNLAYGNLGSGLSNGLTASTNGAGSRPTTRAESPVAHATNWDFDLIGMARGITDMVADVQNLKTSKSIASQEESKAAMLRLDLDNYANRLLNKDLGQQYKNLSAQSKLRLENLNYKFQKDTYNDRKLKFAYDKDFAMERARQIKFRNDFDAMLDPKTGKSNWARKFEKMMSNYDSLMSYRKGMLGNNTDSLTLRKDMFANQKEYQTWKKTFDENVFNWRQGVQKGNSIMNGLGHGFNAGLGLLNLLLKVF